MRVTKRQLRRLIKEAQWGRFTGGAAPLDEPPMDSGPMSPEEQQRVFDMLVDSGSDPKELKATGNYPDVESLDSEVARRYFQRMMGETKMKITKRQLRRIIREVIAPGPAGFSLQDIILGIIKDNPGMGGQDIVSAVQFQPMDPPVERDEIFAVLDELQENDKVFFSVEEDEWWTIEDWNRYNEEGGVWSDERDYEAGFMS